MKIPMRQKRALTNQEPGHVGDGGGEPQARILVLDDIREIISVLARFAHLEGFGVIKAESNADALAHIRDTEIFASLRMAFLDIEVGADWGIDVYNAIRTQSMTLPIVIMSGSAYHKILYPILAYDPCASFMSKPFDMTTIRHLMREPLAWGGDLSRLLQSDPMLGNFALSCAR